MAKCNYFDKLEELSALSAEAVELACGGGDTDRLSALRKNGDRLVCELEDTLFSDFLPPLERDGIAACAHDLSRVMDRAIELSAAGGAPAYRGRPNGEGEICCRLAKELALAVSLLRRIRKPDEMPDLRGFRSLLSEGRAAHETMMAGVRAGAVSRSAVQAVFLTGRLRTCLGECFESLVEVMLKNI